MLDELLVGIDPQERAELECLNAAALYGFSTAALEDASWES